MDFHVILEVMIGKNKQKCSSVRFSFLSNIQTGITIHQANFGGRRNRTRVERARDRDTYPCAMRAFGCCHEMGLYTPISLVRSLTPLIYFRRIDLWSLASPLPLSKSYAFSRLVSSRLLLSHVFHCVFYPIDLWSLSSSSFCMLSRLTTRSLRTSAWLRGAAKNYVRLFKIITNFS